MLCFSGLPPHAPYVPAKEEEAGPSLFHLSKDGQEEELIDGPADPDPIWPDLTLPAEVQLPAFPAVHALATLGIC